MLLERGADTSPMNKFKTPLHIACCHKDGGEVVKLLVEAGADTAARDIDGNTSLHLALKEVRSEKNVIELLLGMGADPTAIDGRGHSPLHLAFSEKAVQLLLDAGASALARDRSEEIPRFGCRRGEGPYKILLAAEQTEQQLRCLAFAMGHHERLGAGSRVRGFAEPEVLRIVLNHLCTCKKGPCKEAPWCECAGTHTTRRQPGGGGGSRAGSKLLHF